MRWGGGARRPAEGCDSRGLRLDFSTTMDAGSAGRRRLRGGNLPGLDCVTRCRGQGKKKECRNALFFGPAESRSYRKRCRGSRKSGRSAGLSARESGGVGVVLQMAWSGAPCGDTQGGVCARATPQRRLLLGACIWGVAASFTGGVQYGLLIASLIPTYLLGVVPTVGE